jgi:glycosyltransferase involved in cell wall biosynthesis
MGDVDIIIITFNRLVMLKELIYSIESQSILPKQVIIYDDISTDGTENFLNLYTGKLNLNVLLGESKSKNIAISRNKCLELVNAQYVIILDDDDLMPPNKVEKTVEIFELSDAKMLTGDTVVFDDFQLKEQFSRPILSDKPCQLKKSFFHGKNPLHWASIAFDSSALKAIGGFDERFTMITDWAVYLRLIDKFECWYSPLIFGYYRIHSNNMSTNMSALISDLEIFSSDELGVDSGVISYLVISKYIYYISQNSVFKAVSVIWGYQNSDITMIRKIKLSVVAVSGCFKYLSSLRVGPWNKLGTCDPRILRFLPRI